jgi:hypothetical protein
MFPVHELHGATLLLRVAAAVQDRQHRYPILMKPVINDVWKSGQHSIAHFEIIRCVDFWRLTDATRLFAVAKKYWDFWATGLL